MLSAVLQGADNVDFVVLRVPIGQLSLRRHRCSQKKS